MSFCSNLLLSLPLSKCISSSLTLAEIERRLAALDARLMPFGSFEDAPSELLDKFAELHRQRDFALNREHVTAPLVAHLGAVTG